MKIVVIGDKKAPLFDENMNYIKGNKEQLIKVYKNINSRFILEGLFAKLALNFNK